MAEVGSLSVRVKISAPNSREYCRYIRVEKFLLLQVRRVRYGDDEEFTLKAVRIYGVRFIEHFVASNTP